MKTGSLAYFWSRDRKSQKTTSLSSPSSLDPQDDVSSPTPTTQHDLNQKEQVHATISPTQEDVNQNEQGDGEVVYQATQEANQSEHECPFMPSSSEECPSMPSPSEECHLDPPHDPGKRMAISSYSVNDRDAVRRIYIGKGPCRPRPNGDFPQTLQGPHVESGAVPAPAGLDESLVLKNKSLQIGPYLNGRCIYLVGMMGSGKTTIGKLLAEVLDYSFFDSDTLVETLEGMSVAEIFNQHGEGYFREKETKVLEEVSTKHHLVISTGGGAVTRPINWRHMQSGVSVWLDVPIDCLARRISAVGTGSRPLLHGEGGDAYTKAYTRLSELFVKRHEAYANANARVFLENIAGKLGKVDVDNLSPSVITIEVLEQIDSFLRKNNPAI